jgi:hypothetical protein
VNANKRSADIMGQGSDWFVECMFVQIYLMMLNIQISWDIQTDYIFYVLSHLTSKNFQILSDGNPFRSGV